MVDRDTDAGAARPRLPVGLRFRILERDHFTCRYCGRQAPAVELEVDHIHPRAKGGSDRPDNLVTACVACNRGKRDRFVPPEQHPVWRTLDAKFFLTHTRSDANGGREIVEDGGVILGNLGDGYYLVDHLSWITGGMRWYGRRVVSIRTIAREGWSFYGSYEEMAEAYQYGGGKSLAAMRADSAWVPPPTRWQRFLGWTRDRWVVQREG